METELAPLFSPMHLHVLDGQMEGNIMQHKVSTLLVGCKGGRDDGELVGRPDSTDELTIARWSLPEPSTLTRAEISCFV